MKKIIRLTEADLVRIVKKVIKENEDESRKFYIIGRAHHLGDKGMFIYTGGDGYSMIPTSIEFRRRIHDEMPEPPMSYDSKKEAMSDLKQIRKGTKHRPDIRWEIVEF